MAQDQGIRTAIDSVLTVSFVAVLFTGLMLHLGKHGVTHDYRATLKLIHWLIGAVMTVCIILHGIAYRKALIILSGKKRWFGISTVVVAIAFLAVLTTGAVKLLSQVRIPHLGLWHYYLGLIMSVAVMAHLWLVFPWLLRKYKH